ncbi:hypothetical protein CHS0354_042772 [Potamilus streckersoni]|uniref:Solute carrier organic anion transporter family member n=1 Tax=Potamilus streckersoni TaxID=2493646 RepID=A0AAE0S9V1_9BIVA|nr:hypothetical protein CHS0354_042772 [Potamilus streckersoni]
MDDGEVSSTLTGTTPGQGYGHSVKFQEDEEYGCFFIKPRYLQRFNTIRWHVFWQCVFNFFEGFAVNGIINVIIPALEKRYSLSSSRSGLIASSYDFGAFLCYLFIGYFGEQRHKPRILAFGIVLMSIGCLIFSLPQFIVGKYEYTVSDISNASDNLCNNKNQLNASKSESSVGDSQNSNAVMYALFVIGQTLIGVGASPMFTLGLTYIDENCKPKLSSFYISWTYCFAAIGVAVGYIVGGQTLSLFVDINRVDPSSVLLTSMDPQWVGAWWIGTTISIGAFLIVAFPILGYPKRLPGYHQLQKMRRSEAHTGIDNELVAKTSFGKSIKDFPMTLLLLLRNLPFLLVSLACSAEALLVEGYATFGVKILHQRFNLDLPTAGSIFGIVTIIGSGGGMLLGGYLVKRFQLKCRGIMRLCSGSMLVSLLLSPTFLIYCPSPSIPGISAFYPGQESYDGLSSGCNEECLCTTASFEPVCSGGEKMMFFNPCFAGCSQVIQANGSKIFKDCKCYNETYTNRTIPDLMSGTCTNTCDWMYVYCVLILLIMIVTFATMSPATTATFRCVPNKMRSMALGISILIVRLLGTTPGPVLLGSIIDKTCQVWESKGGNDIGACWVYNSFDMGVSLIVWWIVLKATGGILFLTASLIYKPASEDVQDDLEINNPTLVPDEIVRDDICKKYFDEETT